jgi:hypothetical protein
MSKSSGKTRLVVSRSRLTCAILTCGAGVTAAENAKASEKTRLVPRNLCDRRVDGITAGGYPGEHRPARLGAAELVKSRATC